MKKSDLRKQLSRLGFPLMEVTEEADANLTLAEVVRSQDPRLWEGFPLVLAFSAGMGMFDFDKTRGRLTSDGERRNFDLLLVMSLALYKALDVEFSWAHSLLEAVTGGAQKHFDLFLRALKNEGDLEVGGRRMSGQRLKVTFHHYFRRERADLKGLLSVREGFELEYALSAVFSPKQKELFLKKLKNEKLTKTEREYFSRVVKKKVLALANTELHHLARKLLG